jgi:lysophospholipase L1-like esterase
MTIVLQRQILILVAAIVIGLLTAQSRILAEERECPVPERFYTFEPQLPKTAKALSQGSDVLIAVLGGASTEGVAAGAPALAWPARFGSALAGKFPAARTKVVNLAVARQTAKAAAERLDRDVLPLKPNLVIWETGTMEAVRGMLVDEFRKTLQAGIDDIRSAGPELVLMNMQFSRDSDAIIDFTPYLSALRQLADANDVPVFRRHGIMRHWAESGSLDFRTGDRDKRQKVAAKLYDCIGRAMADFVARGNPASAPLGR